MKLLFSFILVLFSGMHTSIASEVVYREIPEIINLSDGEVISKEVYQNYSSEDIAYSLVQRMYIAKEKDPKFIRDESTDLYEKAKIQMAFGSHIIQYLKADSGCFKNQHQTGKGSAAASTDLKRRFNAENKIFNIKLEKSHNKSRKNPIHELRPKYAYMGSETYKDYILNEYVTDYGTIYAVLKDHVKQRSTFTYGDSLNNDKQLPGIAHTFNFQFPKIHIKDIKYYETQVWGKLCVKPDVDYFLINCHRGFELTKGQIEELKSLEKPIYKCRQTSTIGTTKGFLKKKKKIFDGNYSPPKTHDERLTCIPKKGEDGYFLADLKTKKYIYGYHFENFEQCLERLESATNNLICSHGSKKTLMIHTKTLDPVYGYYFDSIDACIERAKSGHKGLFCSKGDDGIKMVSTKTGKAIYGYHFNDFDQCEKRIKKVRNNSVCSKGEKGIFLIDVTSEEMINQTQFKNFKQCHKNQ